MISTAAAPIAEQVGFGSLDTVLPFIGPAIEAARHLVSSSPHNNATVFVKNFEKPLGDSLAQASAMAQSDPEQARQILANAYANYWSGIQFFKSMDSMGGMGTVADQSLGNQSLQRTIQSLSGQLGMDLSQIQSKTIPRIGTSGGMTTSIQSAAEAAKNLFSGQNVSNMTFAPSQQDNAPANGTTLSGGSALPNLLSAAIGGIFGSGSNNAPPAVSTPPYAPQTEGGGVSDPNPGVPVTDKSGGILGKVGGAITGALGSIFKTPAAAPGVGTTQPKSLFERALPLILGGAAVGANIYGANAQANASTEATKLQTDAALKAAGMQQDTANKSIDLISHQFDVNQQNQAPWLAAGKGALDTLTGAGPGSLTELTKPFDEKFSFNADDMLKDPGYQRRLQETQQALERSASSKGTLFNPGTTSAIATKVGAQASDEYAPAYNRSLQEYLNRFNIYNANQNNTFNKEASVAGLGQTANTSLQNAGQNMVAGVTGTSQNSTQNINDLLTSLATAQARNNQNATTAKVSGVTNSVDDLTSIIQNYLNNKKAA